MKDIILKAENISKQYRLGLVGTGTLQHDLNRWWHQLRGKEDPYLRIGDANDRSTKGTSDYVWALQDINFEVERGEVLGIIGKNGAGKSTLLKILSKVAAPTTGSIKSRGRISSLLEVGTGFNGEMTGRENIFLNGAILGMTKKEIASKLDEIIDFSGCERYIDTPVKRYSSGMYVRLAFAVAAFLDPEILIIDEVLAVGDAEFQKKAIGKMQDVSKNDGRTVLFVSHNLNTLQKLCQNGILLKNGKITYTGTIENTIMEYISENENKNEFYKNEEILLNEICYIREVRFLNENSIPVTEFAFGEEWSLNVIVQANKGIEHFIIGVSMSNQFDIQVRTTWTQKMDLSIGIHEFNLREMEVLFAPGIYNFDIAISTFHKNIEYIKLPIKLVINENSKNIDDQIINLNYGIVNNKLHTTHTKC